MDKEKDRKGKIENSEGKRNTLFLNKGKRGK